MKKRNKIIIAAVASIAILGGVAACGHHGSPEERADYMVEKVTSKLELSDAQVVELEQLKDELLNVRKSWLEERETVHNQVDTLLSQPTLDQQQALNMVRERTDSISQKAPQVVTALAGFYDSLDPEQQAMLREKIQEHSENRHHWRH